MKFIEIKLTKCIVFLTENEISKLLQSNPELFMEGIKRGKAIKRKRELSERVKQKNNKNLFT